MIAHRHDRYVDGCVRCELSRAEATEDPEVIIAAEERAADAYWNAEAARYAPTSQGVPLAAYRAAYADPGPPELVHLMGDDCLDACASGALNDLGRLVVAPSSTPDRVTCPACRELLP